MFKIYFEISFLTCVLFKNVFFTFNVFYFVFFSLLLIFNLI